MHCLDALVVSSRERIRCENILWVVVVKLQRDLHIKLFVLADSNKVDLAAAGFANMDSVPSAAKLQVHDILKAGCHTVSIYSQERCTAVQYLQDRTFPAFSRAPCPANQSENNGEADKPSPAFPSNCRLFRCPTPGVSLSGNQAEKVRSGF